MDLLQLLALVALILLPATFILNFMRYYEMKNVRSIDRTPRYSSPNLKRPRYHNAKDYNQNTCCYNDCMRVHNLAEDTFPCGVACGIKA